MSLLSNSVAAASAPVGTDLCASQAMQQAAWPRRIRGVGLTGSAAAGDTICRLAVGTLEVGNIYNQTTGFPAANAAMFMIGAYVPPNQEVHVFVVDAPGTNPINLVIDFEDNPVAV